MKLRALIVDDEPLAHEVILEYAEEVPFLDVVGRCHRATEALELLGDREIDLLFLDIRMPKLKGFDLLRILERRPLVIVTSAHEEYALAGYELEVCDYLLKPFRFERFLQACNRALERHRRAHRSYTAADSGTPAPPAPRGPTAAPEHLFVKVDQRWINLPLAEITHLEARGNYVKVWTGARSHLTLRTLKSFEEELPADRFVRIHKSFMVHKRHVSVVEENVVRLDSGQCLPIGKSRRQAFWELMTSEPRGR